MTVSRVDVLVGKTKRIKTGCGNVYVTVNFDEGRPVEVFVRLGKAGGCASSQTEALGRLISLSLKNGTDVRDIIQQMLGIGCHLPIFAGMGRRTLSCADAVAQALKSLCNVSSAESPIAEPPIVVEAVTTSPDIYSSEPCPDCGAGLVMQEGCAKCFMCGFTRC